MLIIIFGASGRVGRAAVAEALARGYTVRAFVHRHPNLPHSPKLQVVRGDIRQPKHVVQALQDAQAVISTLGSWGTPTKDILTSGMTNIIPAMEQLNIERIVSLTGAEAWDGLESLGISRRFRRFALRLLARRVLADGEEHIRLLRHSHLDWTVLRSPVMTDSASIFYKLSLQPLKLWQTIPRRAVAKALLDQLEGPGYIQSAPFLHRY